jgi:L-lactate dehydrogenase complex protein LldG
MLSDVRSALGHSQTLRPEPLSPFVEIERDATTAQTTERFIAELDSVQCHFYQACDGGALSARIVEICRSVNAKQVAVSGADLLSELRLSDSLLEKGFQTVNGLDFSVSDTDELITRLSKCDVGITCVDYAIADTGTLSLSSDERHALVTSLVPPVHIAVLRRRQIYGTLAEVIDRLNTEHMGRVDPSRSATFITGPSRTSDVELTLSIGVHGPAELHVILFEREEDE